MYDARRSFNTFVSLEDVASFLLNEAFRYASLAALHEVASAIFSEHIAEIASNRKPGWSPPPRAQTLSEWLRQRDEMELGFTNDALLKLTEISKSAYAEAASSKKYLSKQHRFESTATVGHIISLSACVETVINRQLYLLSESGFLDRQHYNSLDRTELLPKVLFAFKDKITSGKLSITCLRHLVRLRNKAVHFKASSVGSVQPTVEQLIGIWREVGQVFDLSDGRPTKAELDEAVEHFIDKWIR
jgi:hypothetical protein